MKYFNVQIHWHYGSVTTYHDVTNVPALFRHFERTNQLSAIKKMFFYLKQSRKDHKGHYCGFCFPKPGQNPNVIWKLY